jgi:hypothetical protein
MFGNGVKIFGMITIMAHLLMEVLGKLVDLTGCCAGVRGSTLRSFASVPTAAGTRWASGAGISDFGLRLLSFRALSFRHLGFRHSAFRVFGFCLRGLFFSSLLPFFPLLFFLFSFPSSAEGGSKFFFRNPV